MKCEKCDLRFVCYTTKIRPTKMKINWQVAPTCSRCACFGSINKDGKAAPRKRHISYDEGEDTPLSKAKRKLGICSKTRMLVHRDSICDDCDISDTTRVMEVYDDLRKFMMQKKGKLPRMCELEDGEVVSND